MDQCDTGGRLPNPKQSQISVSGQGHFRSKEGRGSPLERARNKLTLLNAITFEDIRNYIFTLSGYLEVHKDMVSDPSVLSVFEKEKTIVKKVSQSLEFAKDYQDMGIRPAHWQNVLQVYLYAISHLDLSHIERVKRSKVCLFTPIPF